MRAYKGYNGMYRELALRVYAGGGVYKVRYVYMVNYIA